MQYIILYCFHNVHFSGWCVLVLFSFYMIQYDSDVEWKFARTKLWMDYIDEGSTLPVPFNIIPSGKSVKYGFLFLRDLCKELCMGKHEELNKINYDFSVSNDGWTRCNFFKSWGGVVFCNSLLLGHPTLCYILFKHPYIYIYR